MIAIFFFTVVLLAAASMQAYSIKNNTEARRSFQNSIAVTDYLETFLALPYDDPLLEDPDGSYAPDVADHGPFKIASTRATIEWEVDDGFPVPDAKRVRITIRTAGDKGRRKVFTYDYVKTKGFEWK